MVILAKLCIWDVVGIIEQAQSSTCFVKLSPPMDFHSVCAQISEEKMWRWHGICLVTQKEDQEEVVLSLAQVCTINGLKGYGGTFFMDAFTSTILFFTSWMKVEG